jgi:hypothetical protein
MTESKRPVLRLKLPVKVDISAKLATPKANEVMNNPVEVPALKTHFKKPVKAKQVTDDKLIIPRAEFKKLFKQLCAKYPKAFDINNKRVRILATGVHKQIATELGWNIKMTRSFLYILCNTKKYKAACIKGANRYDLQGKVVGKVE